MRYRPLGTTGTKVSAISLGSWLTYGGGVDARTTDACVRTAFEHGVVFFDTADIYERGAAEEALAAALAPLRRQDYVLATKVFWPMSENVNDQGLSRKHVFESCHASLRRLRTDYLDLYQCHRHDPGTPLEEVVRAMEDLIRAGKVLYWGTSCWTAAQIAAASELADRLGAYRPVTNQPPYNLIQREIETEVLEVGRRYGLRQVVFSPLAQGLLTGKYSGGKLPPGSRAAHERRGFFLRQRLTDEPLSVGDRVVELARELGCTPAQLALAWVLRRDEVSSAIFGATSPEQVVENVAAAELDLDPGVFARMDAWTQPPQPPSVI